jgi:hypothetical protein
MDCAKIEQWLSDYMESSLPAGEMSMVKDHLDDCRNCSDLLDAMRSVISARDSYPAFEMDPDLLEKILLRTSGRPRTIPFRERFHHYVIRPFLTPRLAAGISLATMFLAFTTYLMLPRMSAVMSAASPSDLFQLMDRGVQKLYGEGLKAYYKKNDLQAQYTYYKNSTLNKLRFVIGQMDVPIEGQKKPEEPMRDRERPSGQKSSWTQVRPAHFG